MLFTGSSSITNAEDSAHSLFSSFLFSPAAVVFTAANFISYLIYNYSYFSFFFLKHRVALYAQILEFSRLAA